jgi:hypothetical protein
VNDPHGDDRLEDASGAAQRPRRFFVRRSLWHTAGLLLALAVLWLIFRAYTRPEALLDFANFRLC